MSLKTWKEEFYPVPPRARMTKRQAIEHSLRKWQGLKKTNLKKHKVVSDKDLGRIHGLYDGFTLEFLKINSETCALCAKYLNEEADSEMEACEKCPLFQHLGKPCDINRKSPYAFWRLTNNPRPMIKALQKTLEEA